MGAKLFSSYLALAAGSVGGQILGFVGVAVVTRRLGPHLFGDYGFASAVAGYFALPLLGGLGLIGVRDLARDLSQRWQVVAEVETLQILNAVLAYAVLFVLAPLFSTDSLTQSLLRLLGLNLIISGFTLDWVIQGHQQMGRLAVFRFAGQVIYLVALLLLITGGSTGVTRYALCNLLGASVTAMLAITWVVRMMRSRSPGLRAVVCLRVEHLVRRLRLSLSAGIGLVMVAVYFSCDVVLLGILRGNYAVGEYTAAEKLPTAVAAFTTLWVSVFYPHAAATFHKDRDQLRRQVGEFVSLSLLVALPFIPVGFLLGHQILDTLFGARFGPAGVVFALLLCGAGVGLVNSNLTQLLLICGAERWFTRAVAAGACLNLVANLILIPLWGMTGSACATIAAELVVIAVASPRLVRQLGAITLRSDRLLRAIAPLAGLTASLILLGSIAPWWVALAVGCLVYVLLLDLTHSLRFREVGRLIRQARVSAEQT